MRPKLNRHQHMNKWRTTNRAKRGMNIGFEFMLGFKLILILLFVLMCKILNFSAFIFCPLVVIKNSARLLALKHKKLKTVQLMYELMKQHWSLKLKHKRQQTITVYDYAVWMFSCHHRILLTYRSMSIFSVHSETYYVYCY